MANPRKPHGLKVVAGTDQPCRREPEPTLAAPAVDALPDAPLWLPNSHASQEWKRLGAILIANKLLNEANLMAFATLCALYGKIVQLFAAGETPTAHLLAQYRNLINDFGLTPVAQGKVKAGGDKDAGNKFAKFKDKPAG